MTFRLDRAPGAPQAFTVTVETKPQTAVSDPDGCQEFPPIENEIFPFA